MGGCPQYGGHKKMEKSSSRQNRVEADTQGGQGVLLFFFCDTYVCYSLVCLCLFPLFPMLPIFVFQFLISFLPLVTSCHHTNFCLPFLLIFHLAPSCQHPVFGVSLFLDLIETLVLSLFSLCVNMCLHLTSHLFLYRISLFIVCRVSLSFVFFGPGGNTLHLKIHLPVLFYWSFVDFYFCSFTDRHILLL